MNVHIVPKYRTEDEGPYPEGDRRYVGEYEVHINSTFDLYLTPVEAEELMTAIQHVLEGGVIK